MELGNHAYPILVEKDGDSFVLSARDIPHFAWVADSVDQIHSEALSSLMLAIGYIIKAGEPVAKASPPLKDEVLIELPLSFVSKVILHNTMLKNNIRPADLARRMNLTTSEIARITNPRYKSKIDTVAQAVNAAGGQLRLYS